MKQRKINCVIWKEDDWYVSRALEVEVASQGRTEKEALENLKEALELYFEDQNEIELTPVKSPKLQNLSIRLHA